MTSHGAKIHHLLTNKSIKSGFTKEFKKILDNAGIGFNDLDNLLPMFEHSDAHGAKVWEPIEKELNDLLKTVQPDTEEYTKTVKDYLEELGKNLLMS